MKLETRSRSLHPIYLLILVAIVLRMVILPTRPLLWGDEALTYGRVCGSYRDMLDYLQKDGFVPLHYELYWLLGRVFRLDPIVMRMVPELCGVLMVPAIYFLSRQFAGRKTSFLVAAFTTASAYMNNYSRDAKMYCDFWLFCILSTACYLWWINSWQKPQIRGIAWLAWIATGLAMVGLHIPGLALLALPPLFLITQRRPHWKQSILTVIGLAVIVAGPAGYYWKFNSLQERSEERSFENASGVFWVATYNEGRSGPDHVLYATSAYLLSWEWPRDSDMQLGVPLGYSRVFAALTVALLAFAALGALPWPYRWRGEQSEPAFAPARPWWRGVLWLAFWMVVPVYGFYCASVPGFVSPVTWTTYRPIQYALGALAVLWLCYPYHDSFPWRLKSATQFALIAAAIWLCCLCIYHEFPDQPNGSIWIPRYMGMVWPAFAIALCSLLMRLPTRPVRWAAIALLLGVNLFKTGARLYADTEPPLDRMARDVVDSDATRREIIGDRVVDWQPHHFEGPLTRTYIEQFPLDVQHPGHGSIFTPDGRYYLAMDENWSLTPREFRSMPMARSADYFYDIPPAASIQILADAKENPALGRLIVWNHYTSEQTPDNSLDEKLGAGWRRVSDENFTARMFWMWQDLATFRRREYVRAGVPYLRQP